ncbi:unnamed protein product [Schistocephalus solidus]|uniref:Hydrocephalus-inducing protein homolog n=1 Tax=Schistocephalus solidus TaxID=70667 RepID=A0A183SDE2_SCHSO|nr:unnamed protein product [Schistocephalus solidus]
MLHFKIVSGDRTEVVSFHCRKVAYTAPFSPAPTPQPSPPDAGPLTIPQLTPYNPAPPSTPLTPPLTHSGRRVHIPDGYQLGSVFFPLPDGMGLLYHVSGFAEPPKSMGKFNIEFRAREPHEVVLEVPNWLPRPQRFTVTRMLVRPDKADLNLSISGLEHIDVAGNTKKQYKLTISAQKEGSTQLKGFATFEFLPLLPGEYNGRLEVSSHELGVFTHDLDFLATTAPMEEVVSFEVHLGQSSSKMVRFSNLTKLKADFTCKISNGDFQCDKLITVAPGIEASLPVTFEPITIGESTSTLTIFNAQAGEYVFPLHGTAKLPVPQGPIVVRNKETAYIVFKNVFPITTEFFIQVENPAFHVAQASRIVRPQREFHIPILLEANLTPTVSRTSEEPTEGTVICGKLVVTCARSFAVPTSGRTEKLTSKATASEEAHREFQIPSHLQWIYYLKGILN